MEPRYKALTMEELETLTLRMMYMNGGGAEEDDIIDFMAACDNVMKQAGLIRLVLEGKMFAGWDRELAQVVFKHPSEVPRLDPPED